MEDNFNNLGFWRAGELAKEAGVSTDTLRHYERKKVLPSPRRSASGYRMYPKSSLEQIALVRRALAVGFTLDELALILGERDKGGSPCDAVHKLASLKLKQVEQQLKSLKVLRNVLRETVTNWGERLSGSPVGGQARLLETLPDLAGTKGMTKLAPNSERKKEGKK